MKVLAVIDMLLAVFLMACAVNRLFDYDYKNQSIVYFLSREEHVYLSLFYWIACFGTLSLQMVVAFLLLTATMDMTSDTETMLRKCIWWRTLSTLIFLWLIIDLSVILYEHLVNELELRVFQVVLDSLELVFRAYGVCFVGRFISDLHNVFEAPMVQYGNGGVIPPSPPISPDRQRKYKTPYYA